MKAQIEIVFDDGSSFTAVNVDMEREQMTIREEALSGVDMQYPFRAEQHEVRSFLSLSDVELQPDEHGICYVITTGAH